MGESKSKKSFFFFNYKSIFEKKYWVWTVFVFSLFIFFSGGFGIIAIVTNDSYNANSNKGYCGDDTVLNGCSDIRPYFCLSEKLIEFPFLCGCPDSFNSFNGVCVSNYHTNPKTIHLKYFLNGKENFIDFVAYEGFANYVSEIPRSIKYTNGYEFSREDFKLKAINEEEQRKFLLPLVIQIQNITDNKDDQARIAISIVQNIPFGSSNKTTYFFGEEINHTRYPYEVLYDFQGVCGEKSDLLSFLLRELGYGVSFFYYPLENHEAIGIKCPIEESLMETEYCFVETTSPSLITDSQISYVGVGKLYSTPEIYILSDGISLGYNLEEYKDADKLIRIRNSIDKSGLLGPFNRKILNDLKDEYGLTEIYYR